MYIVESFVVVVMMWYGQIEKNNININNNKFLPGDCKHVYKLFDEHQKLPGFAHVRNLCPTQTNTHTHTWLSFNLWDLMAYGYGKHVQKTILLERIQTTTGSFVRFWGPYSEMGRTFSNVLLDCVCIYVLRACECTLSIDVYARKCCTNVTDANCNTETFHWNSQQNNI